MMGMFRKIAMCMLLWIFVFSMADIQDADAGDKCYCMFYNSRCLPDNNFEVSTWPCLGWIIFEDIGSPVTGFYLTEWLEEGGWFKWKSNFMFEMLEVPFWFYSGTKKQGFAQDTWGDRMAVLGDCYYLKKINCKSLITVLGTDMKSLKEETKSKTYMEIDRSYESLKARKGGYCEYLRHDKDFQAERFEFGEPEEETEE